MVNFMCELYVNTEFYVRINKDKTTFSFEKKKQKTNFGIFLSNPSHSFCALYRLKIPDT